MQLLFLSTPVHELAAGFRWGPRPEEQRANVKTISSASKTSQYQTEPKKKNKFLQSELIKFQQRKCTDTEREEVKRGPAADENANKEGKGAENGNPLGGDFSSAPVLNFLHVCVNREREREPIGL